MKKKQRKKCDQTVPEHVIAQIEKKTAVQQSLAGFPLKCVPTYITGAGGGLRFFKRFHVARTKLLQLLSSCFNFKHDIWRDLFSASMFWYTADFLRRWCHRDSLFISDNTFKKKNTPLPPTLQCDSLRRVTSAIKGFACLVSLGYNLTLAQHSFVIFVLLIDAISIDTISATHEYTSDSVGVNSALWGRLRNTWKVQQSINFSRKLKANVCQRLTGVEKSSRVNG